MSRIECAVVTGFLGSGKTSLLNAFLRWPQARGTAVLVNEIGDIGIDQLILAEVADNLMLLESGCLCCTLTGTLRETLLDLITKSEQNGYPLERIIIETTGLAEPLPILHSLLGDKILTDVIRLGQVVVTVDAMNGLDQLQRHPECARQVAAADLAILTKPDLANETQRQRIHAAIEQVNPLARRAEAIAGEGVEALLLATQQQDLEKIHNTTAALQDSAFATASETNPLAAFHSTFGSAGTDTDTPSAGGYLGDAQAYHRRIRTQSFQIEGPVYWPGIAAWWHMLTLQYGDNLLRCKGLLRITDTVHPIAFIQGVGQFFHPPKYLDQWPTSNPEASVVCIGSGLDRSWLQSSLRALKINEAGLRPTSLQELDAVIPEKLNAQ